MDIIRDQACACTPSSKKKSLESCYHARPLFLQVLTTLLPHLISRRTTPLPTAAALLQRRREMLPKRVELLRVFRSLKGRFLE